MQSKLLGGDTDLVCVWQSHYYYQGLCAHTRIVFCFPILLMPFLSLLIQRIWPKIANCSIKIYFYCGKNSHHNSKEQKCNAKKDFNVNLSQLNFAYQCFPHSLFTCSRYYRRETWYCHWSLGF